MKENEFFVLKGSGLEIKICYPGSYYKGVRFDWSGVIRSISLNGNSVSDLWFDSQNAFAHDHLTGPSEEFQIPAGYDEAPEGGSFLKVGVGMLIKPDNAPYDRFRYYEISDKGSWKVFHGRRRAVFIHRMKGRYIYVKIVRISGSNSFRISHFLKNTGKSRLCTEQYNHNFFTMGLDRVGAERSIQWGFPVDGHWREDSVNASKTSDTIHIDAAMQPGQKAFIGDLTATEPYEGGYSFTLRANEKSVSAVSDKKMSKAVFWSNHRVCCPEPYIPIDLAPGKHFCWKIDYTLSCPCSGE